MILEVKMSFNINNLLDSAGEFLGLNGDPFTTPLGQKVGILKSCVSLIV